MKSIVIVILGSLLTAGCATRTLVDSGSQRVLVLFDVSGLSAVPFVGPDRSYHSGSRYDVPLHVRSSARRVARKFNLKEIDAWPIASVQRYCVVYGVASDVELDELLDALASDEEVAEAQRMNDFEGLLWDSYDDPLFDLQYGAYRARVQAVHEVSRGKNVKIGIIDTSVDTDHPDLQGQIARSVTFVEKDPVSGRVHGTAIAGVIGARTGNGEGVVGLAPDATIYAYGACRLDGDKPRCTTFSLAQAIEAAIEDRIDVLNISIAGPDDPLLTLMLEHAYHQGMVIVAATHPTSSSQNFPASLDYTVAVDARSGDSWFASPELFSTQAGGGYRVFFGSSIAAAGVTSVAAIIRSRLDAAATTQTLTQLLSYSCPIDLTGSPLHDPLCTSPLH